MPLLDRISDDFKTAMKAKDEAKVSTLRMLKAALKNKQIDLMHELSEEETLAVVKSQIKQLKDSLESFVTGNRPDMAEAAKKEIGVLEGYLPAQMDEETLKEVVKQSLDAAGIKTKSEMGKAMGVVMKAVAGRADGTRVRAMVESLLAVVAIFAFLVLPHSLWAATEPPPVFLETSLRVARIFLLLMGIICINSILMSGFIFMIHSGSDHAHHEALHKLSWGLLGSILIAGLFAITTAWLQKVKSGI